MDNDTTNCTIRNGNCYSSVGINYIDNFNDNVINISLFNYTFLPGSLIGFDQSNEANGGMNIKFAVGAAAGCLSGYVKSNVSDEGGNFSLGTITNVSFNLRTEWADTGAAGCAVRYRARQCLKGGSSGTFCYYNETSSDIVYYNWTLVFYNENSTAQIWRNNSEIAISPINTSELIGGIYWYSDQSAGASGGADVIWNVTNFSVVRDSQNYSLYQSIDLIDDFELTGFNYTVLDNGGNCTYYYSTDNTTFVPLVNNSYVLFETRVSDLYLKSELYEGCTIYKLNSTFNNTYFPPNLSQSNLNLYNITIPQNQSRNFVLQINHSLNYSVNYTINDSFDDSYFNISYNITTIDIINISNNYTLINIEVYNNASLSNYTGNISLNDTYGNNITTFPVYIEVIEGSPILTVSPNTWNVAVNAADVFSKVFNLSNTGYNGTFCTVNSSSISPSINVSNLNVSQDGYVIINVTYSLAAGNYNEDLTFSCNGSSTTVGQVFTVASIVGSTTGSGGGGGSVTITTLNLPNITMKNEFGGDSLSLIVIKGSSKEFDVYIYNKGESAEKITLFCEDFTEGACENIVIDETEILNVQPSSDPYIVNFTFDTLELIDLNRQSFIIGAKSTAGITVASIDIGVSIYPEYLNVFKRFLGIGYVFDGSYFKEDAKTFRFPVIILYIFLILLSGWLISMTKLKKGRKALYLFLTSLILFVLSLIFIHFSCGTNLFICT